MRRVSTEQPLTGTEAAGTEYGAYDKPTCAICGCTAEAPCFGGDQPCYWVTMNSETNAGTCSACLGF